MPRILLKGEKKVVAHKIPKILFFKGCYEVSPDSDVLEVVPSKKMGGLPVALWQVHSVETGQAGGGILVHPVYETLCQHRCLRSRHNRNTAAEAG